MWGKNRIKRRRRRRRWNLRIAVQGHRTAGDQIRARSSRASSCTSGTGELPVCGSLFTINRSLYEDRQSADLAAGYHVPIICSTTWIRRSVYRAAPDRPGRWLGTISNPWEITIFLPTLKRRADDACHAVSIFGWVALLPNLLDAAKRESFV